MQSSTRYRHFSGALAALALLAMAVRALTPAGYMLAPGEIDGRFVAVTMCTGHGPVATDERNRETPKKQDNAAPCVFAAAGAALAPTPDTPIETPRFASQEIAPHATQALGVGRMAAPPPWATGPPRAL